MRASLLAILAAGCTQTQNVAPSQLQVVDPGTGVAAQVVPLVSASGTPSVAIRVVNSYGIAVPSDTPISVSVAGALLDSDTVTTDTFGYATVQLQAPGPGRYLVTADGVPGEVWVTGAPPPQVRAIRSAAYPIEAPYPAFAAAGSGGSAFAGEDQIWWQPHAPGAVAWLTADLPGTIEGMWPVHFDSDGVLDLAVWAGSQVVALRGWPGGGYAWGGAWEVPDGVVAGLSVGDLDGDRSADIVVAINYGDDASEVEVLLGDGEWGFVPMEPLQLTFPVDSVTAADEDVDGQPDITVLRTADGTLRRFSWSEDGWVGGTPSQIGEGAYQALEGSTLLPMADLDGDATLEVLVQGAPGASSQELVFFSLSGQSIVKYEQSYASYYVTVGDLEGDGADEVVAIADGTLHLTRFDGTGGSYVAQNYSDVASAGPVAIVDLDSNDLLDLVVFSDQPMFHPGAASEGAASPPGDPDCQDGIDNDSDGTTDLEDPQCASWRPASYTWRTFALALVGPYLIVDLNRDGRDDILGFSDTGDRLQLGAWMPTPDEDGALQLSPGTALSFGSAEALGLVTCGGEYFALTQNNGQPVLSEIFVSSAGTVTQGDWEQVDGTLLACGTIGTVNVAAVVAATDGAWTSYNRNAAAVDSGFIEAVSAIAVADPDGDGVGEVVGCQGDGCAIVAADLDGDGLDEVVRAEAAGLVVEGWGTSRELPGTPGPLRAVDADADGAAEILLTEEDSGRMLWFRGVVGGVAPPIGWWRSSDVLGAAALGDVDGDGRPELLVPSSSGGLSHTPTAD